MLGPRHVRLFLLLAVLGVAALTAPAAHAATPRPVIDDAVVIDAPIGEKGGIMTPFVGCSNFRVEPRVRVVMKSLESDWTRSFRWRGAFPAAGFPRAAVGQYKIRTAAWCHGNKRTRTELVTVVEKTRRATVSSGEFRRIKRGMTRERVREIVGYGGTAAGFYAGKRVRTYDMMAFWAFAIVEYREGRVVRGSWDVDHD